MRLVLTGLILVFAFACINSTNDKKKAEKPANTDTTQHKSKEELRADISDEINAFIKGGFHDQEEIFENIQDMFYKETLDEFWTKQEINKQYVLRLTEQSTWPKQTDFDKLALVFDKLNSSGIIALHNAGYTIEDGEDAVQGILDNLKAKGKQPRGCCFYHTQDMDRAIDGENLYLAFGDLNNIDKASIKIGKEIMAALKQEGFKIIWNSSSKERIEIKDIKWQKRFGNDNCSEERAIRLLSKR